MASVKAPQTRGSQRARAPAYAKWSAGLLIPDRLQGMYEAFAVRRDVALRRSRNGSWLLHDLRHRLTSSVRPSRRTRDVMVAGRDLEHGARSGGADGALAPTAGTSSAG